MTETGAEAFARLYEAARTCSSELRQAKTDVEQRRERAEALLAALHQELTRPAARALERTKYTEAFQDWLRRAQEETATWALKVQGEVRRHEFTKHWESSLLIMVLGKVNCGKSSMGNIMAAVPLREQGHPIASAHPVEFFRWEEGRGPVPLAEARFQDGQSETTSQIQGFTVDGMTWLDTPGVHSMTRAHQERAREYASCAELMLYLTSADAPMRRGDLDEFTPLLNMGLALEVLVTKADTPDEVWDEDDYVRTDWHPSSEEDRRVQRDFILQELTGVGLLEKLHHQEPIFTSSYLAAQHLDGGPSEDFAASGFSNFLRRLTATLESGPQELKTRAPRNRFNAFLDSILSGSPRGSIDGLRRDLGQLVANLEEARLRLFRARNEVIERALRDAHDDLNGCLERASTVLKETGSAPPTWRDEASGIVVRKLQHVLEAELRGALGTAEAGLARFIESAGAFEVEAPDMHLEWKKERGTNPIARFVGRLVGTLVALAARWARLPDAACVGIVEIFGETADQLFGRTEYQVLAGTNAHQILEHLRANLAARLTPYVDRIVQQVCKSFLSPLEQEVRALDRRLGRLHADLECLKYEKEPTL